MASALVLARGLAGGDAPRPTVLIMLPGQPSGTQLAIDAFGSGAREALRLALPAGSAIYTEYTDLARLGEPGQQRPLRDWYATKYAGERLDLIIAAGREPRVFLLRFRDALWPEVPIIFSEDGRAQSPGLWRRTGRNVAP